MLIRHSLFYFLARGGSGLIAFLAIYVYTRLLKPDEYGVFAMLISSMSMVSAIFFQWLNLGLARYYGAYRDRRDVILSTVIAGFFLAAIATAAIAFLVVTFFSYRFIDDWVFVMLPLAWALAWFELNQRIANVDLQPIRYGLMAAFKAAVGLATGVALYGILGIHGVLLGVFLSALFVPFVFSYNIWLTVRKALIEAPLLRMLFYYGLPLAVGHALTVVVDVSDRFLIAAYRDAAEAGLYSAAYDLVQQVVGVPMIIAYLASFPLILREIDARDSAVIRQRLSDYFVLLAAVSTPILVLFGASSSGVAEVLLGSAYRSAARELMPIIAVAIVLGSLKLYYFDLSFQLGQRTSVLVWPAFVAASLNIVLNMFWIPIYGFHGAAYATLAAFAIGLAMSAALARRIYPLPLASPELLKIFSAGAVMGGVLSAMPTVGNVEGFFIQSAAGGISYCLMLFALNVAQSRARLLRLLLR